MKKGCDVWVTHGPPRGYRDQYYWEKAPDHKDENGKEIGKQVIIVLII